jgi:hypothetical protein
MLAGTDGQDVTAIGQQFKELVAALLEEVSMPPMPVEIDITPDGNFRGFDGGLFYVVRRGSITVRYQDKSVYILEEGDILLPDIAGSHDQVMAVFYGSATGATLHSFPALDFMQRVFSEPAAIRLWSRLLVAYSGLMLRLAAAKTPEDTAATPGFEVYEPGDVIIRQGERADYVFHMTSGLAEVLVNNVNVGCINDGEIFGAMAALTHADRSATVKAKTSCSVVKVPKEQFTELIKSNPATIHSLMIDMANSVVNLNEQLVGLRSSQPST